MSPRAVLAREALVVDSLQALQMIRHHRSSGATGHSDATSVWRGLMMLATDTGVRPPIPRFAMVGHSASRGYRRGGGTLEDVLPMPLQKRGMRALLRMPGQVRAEIGRQHAEDRSIESALDRQDMPLVR